MGQTFDDDAPPVLFWPRPGSPKRASAGDVGPVAGTRFVAGGHRCRACPGTYGGLVEAVDDNPVEGVDDHHGPGGRKVYNQPTVAGLPPLAATPGLMDAEVPVDPGSIALGYLKPGSQVVAVEKARGVCYDKSQRVVTHQHLTSCSKDANLRSRARSPPLQAFLATFAFP